MRNYDKDQLRLVNKSERAHEAGLRHSGISGDICESLLIKILRKLIPSFNFGKGQMITKNLEGAYLKKEDLSKQIDIIIFKGKPKKKIGDFVAVFQEKVQGIMEVKKWAYPKMLERNKKLKEILKIKKFPVFFVAFRFHDRKNKKINWDQKIKKLRLKNHYCFSGNYSRKRNKNLYPWQEKEHPSIKYFGEFKKLIRDIKNLQ